MELCRRAISVHKVVTALTTTANTITTAATTTAKSITTAATTAKTITTTTTITTRASVDIEKSVNKWKFSDHYREII